MKKRDEYLALISADAAPYAETLSAYCAEVILLPPCRAADRRIAAHPDTLFAQLGDTLLTSAAYAAQIPDVLDALVARTSARLILSDTPLGQRYPDDVPYNVLVHGQCLYGLTAHLSPDVTREAQRQGYALRSVRQGYAGCAALSCGNTVITADLSIARAAAADGADVLFAGDERISLDGFACGFIGGAGGVCGNTVFFFGTPSAVLRHELTAREIPMIALADTPLADFGGIRFVKIAT